MSNSMIYRLPDDVYLAYDKVNKTANLIKLNDDDYIFRANLVAAEIIRQFDGKKTFETVITTVSASYDDKYSAEIRTKALDLARELLKEGLIVEA